jgi:hypothetical protein
MSVFQHPHLTRGIVRTAKGAFVVSRGLVEVPDEIGESLGWRTVELDENQPERERPRPQANSRD